LTTQIDFQILKTLRALFLNPSEAGVLDYWNDPKVLHAYHQVLGERIRWKWQSVLRALGTRQQALKELLTSFDTVVDWGCGTGVASQALANWLNEMCETSEIQFPKNWLVSDRSRLAMEFASQQLEKSQQFRQLNVLKSQPNKCPTGANVLGLISHVLTELKETQLDELLNWVRKCGAVLWVEPGTPYCGDIIVKMRQRLLEDGFVPLAPCPHFNACPFSKTHDQTSPDAHSNDWCHFHAQPPNEAFQTAFWAKVSKEMKLDLRDLSVSYLFMVKDPKQMSVADQKVLLGRLHRSKVHSGVLFCTTSGLQKKEFSNKKDRALLKDLDEQEPGEVFE
jgi:ribosomal protein RSM22 (predicted rRNA methylase)